MACWTGVGSSPVRKGQTGWSLGGWMCPDSNRSVGDENGVRVTLAYHCSALAVGADVTDG